MGTNYSRSPFFTKRTEKNKLLREGKIIVDFGTGMDPAVRRRRLSTRASTCNKQNSACS